MRTLPPHEERSRFVLSWLKVKQPTAPSSLLTWSSLTVSLILFLIKPQLLHRSDPALGGRPTRVVRESWVPQKAGSGPRGGKSRGGGGLIPKPCRFKIRYGMLAPDARRARSSEHPAGCAAQLPITRHCHKQESPKPPACYPLFLKTQTELVTPHLDFSHISPPIDEMR